MGVVRIMALREMLTEETNQRFSRGISPIPAPLPSFDQSQAEIRPSKSWMPATQAKLIWKLMEVMTRGFSISITSPAKARAEGASYSRRSSWASNISATIRQARDTEGVNPAARANRYSTGNPTRAVSSFRLRVRTRRAE